MNRIAVLIDNDFEDSEYSEPAKAFKQVGHQLLHVGITRGDTVKGKKKGTSVKIERAVNDVTVDEFDALFIPGGYSPDHLRIDENAVKFTRDFVESGKPVFAICHAPQLLINADVIRGRTLTGWKSIIQDIKNAGGKFVDREVVEDGNLITSRNPQDIPAFVERSVQKLQPAHV